MLRIAARGILGRGCSNPSTITKTINFFSPNADFRNVCRDRVTWSRAGSPLNLHGGSVRNAKAKAKKTNAALKASSTAAAVASATIFLAVVRPLRAPIPAVKLEEFYRGWDEASGAGDLEAARRVCWEASIAWLQYHFGDTVTFVDEGAFTHDILTWLGLYLSRQDIRVFWVPVPEDWRADMPVVYVAIHSRFNAKRDLSNIRDKQDEDQLYCATAQDKMMRARLSHEYLEPWKAEGRFAKHCFVVMRYVGVTSYLVYEAGDFTGVNPDNDIESDYWAEDAFAISLL